MVAFCSAERKSQLWVDFKIEICVASKEKENRILYITYKEQLKLTLDNSKLW